INEEIAELPKKKMSEDSKVVSLVLDTAVFIKVSSVFLFGLKLFSLFIFVLNTIVSFLREFTVDGIGFREFAWKDLPTNSTLSQRFFFCFFLFCLFHFLNQLIK